MKIGKSNKDWAPYHPSHDDYKKKVIAEDGWLDAMWVQE